MSQFQFYNSFFFYVNDVVVLSYLLIFLAVLVTLYIATACYFIYALLCLSDSHKELSRPQENSFASYIRGIEI